jgi:RND superfamily putative drug exporter
MTEALARACSRHPWRTLAGWVVAAIAAVALAATSLSGRLTTDSKTTLNPDSARAAHALAKAFPQARGFSDLVIVRSDRYTASEKPFRDFVARLVAAGRKEGLKAPPGATPPRSADGHAILIPLALPKDEAAKPAERVVDRFDGRDGFTVTITGDHSIGNDFTTLSQEDLRKGELQFGLPAALVVLVLVFGAVVAGLVPLLMAVLSIVVGIGLVAAVAQIWELSVFVVNMLTGMGLALGIDYSLFVISRYREERGRGLREDAAIAAAGATASRAVLFSGSAFVVAMFGMLIVPTTIMRSLAAGAILVGVVSVAAALTLLPAVLGLLGDGVNRLRVPRFGASAGAGSPEGRFWRAVIDRVLRRPVVSIVAATALFVVCAIPLFGIHIGASGVTTLPDRFPSKRGYAQLQRDFPHATADPVRIVATAAAANDAPALAKLRSELAADARFGAGTIQRSPTVAELRVPVAGDPVGKRATAAVRDLRSRLIPNAFGGTADQVYVGGKTGEYVDYFDAVTRPAPYVLAFVLGLTFVLLAVAFRSLVVPATAVVLNLLSVGAAYGLLVLVFQHGFAAGLLGFQHSPTIEAWVPLFLFSVLFGLSMDYQVFLLSVLFGLSMDYQVFLLSRIKERYDESRDTTDAVSWGVASTARIITGAALIIVVVFLGFAAGDLIMFQQMGFGVAVALLLDATVIRSILLPSAMKLLGRRNWFFPRWLGWVPDLQVERTT